MDGPPSRDRLAVWTYVQHGEEILCGDPSVTDAERAAAGRETLAGRWQAVLPGNRSRAAAQYSHRCLAARTKARARACPEVPPLVHFRVTSAAAPR